MIPSLRQRLGAVAIALLAGVLPGKADPVLFSGVEASFHGGKPAELRECIDGIEAGPHGWRVAPRIGEPHSAIFRTSAPLSANAVQLTLYFLSGRFNNAIAEFAISATTDAVPSLTGRWEPLRIVRFRAERAKLARTTDNHLQAEETQRVVHGLEGDDVYSVTVRTERDGITGFRLDVFPVTHAEPGLPEDPESFPSGPVASRGIYGDFVLTEFRAESLGNVALGAPVKSTHPIFGTMQSAALTDGLPSTIAHPLDPGLGRNFHFEIDLGRVVAVDHLTLRGRNDGNQDDYNRLSRLWVQLYDRDPAGAVKPVWQRLHRADGSFPKEGQPDVLRAEEGEAGFHGQYIRLSSDSPVPLSPQIAEVEVYATRTPALASLFADGQAVPVESGLSVPAGSRRLALEFNIPQPGKSPLGLLRWRIEGLGSDWQIAHIPAVTIPCPRPGSYVLQAQAGHSDGIWDATLFSRPLTVHQPFTETLAFRWLVAAGALAGGALVMMLISRRRIAAFRTQTALAAERRRIARDMHDEVGARLSQILMLQNIFAHEYALPAPAREEMRQLTQNTEQAITSLDEVVWTVNPQNDTLAAMAEFLAHYASSYLHPAQLACRIHIPIDWPVLEVRSALRHELVAAFKEALHNVVKHAQAHAVTVTLALEAGAFIVTVADDGRGLPETPGGPGKDGLANMKSRLATIGGTCEFLPRATGGTEVRMRVPLPR
ncbi:MAG: sensor histidine kinase [Prosthecobacter sp.]|uniref:sensor histidine kinase n=1 Tax=Prosthecobacter sp. TaxID=1965333 RepID=UPI0038FF4E25